MPQALTRRVLELLTYLAKHHVRMAREMLTLRVPTPEEQAQLIERKSVRCIPVCHTRGMYTAMCKRAQVLMSPVLTGPGLCHLIHCQAGPCLSG